MAVAVASSGGDLASSAILAVLGRHGSLSRAEIARMINLSPATVTQVTKSLLKRNLIEELESVPSAGGRPARLIGLVQAAGVAIGVKVAAKLVEIVSVGIDGTILSAHSYPYDAAVQDAFERLAVLLEGTIAELTTQILGVGVGVAGSVNSQDSGIVDAPTLGWSEARLGPFLRERLQIPVIVENDVNALAVAERLYGTGQTYSSFLTITIGRGIGCGMIVNGELQRGAFGGAGEIGHLPTMIDGPLCDCGAQGCLETIVGQKALESQARELGLITESSGLDAVLRLAQEGNAQAEQLFKSAGVVLGRAIAAVVHIIDPQIVVLLGEGIAAWEFWQPGFEKGFRSGQWATRKTLPYVVEPWDDDKWALGAAALVLAAPFDASNTAGGQGRLVRERLGTSVSGEVKA